LSTRPKPALSELLDEVRAGGSADVMRDETVQVGRLPGHWGQTDRDEPP